MKHHALPLVLCLAFALMLSGCASILPTGVRPSSDRPGFYAPDQVVSGGRTVANGNFVGAEAEANPDGTTSVSLVFASGSTKQGTSMTTSLSAPPTYTVTTSQDPSRVIVTFPSLAYWDYEDHTQAGLLLGMFPQALDNGGIALHLQLASNCNFKVVEAKEQLQLTIAPTTGLTPVAQYHVVAAAYDLWAAGVFEKSKDYQPTLSSDGFTLAVLSRGYPSQEEAHRHMDRTAAMLGGIAPERKLAVVLLAPDELPGYPSGSDPEALAARAVFYANGHDGLGTLIASDARFLAAAPDGSLTMARPRLEDILPGELIRARDTLWQYDADGNCRPLTQMHFSSIISAVWIDESRLAVIDDAPEGRTLYLIDTLLGTLIDLSESIAGRDTLSIAPVPGGGPQLALLTVLNGRPTLCIADFSQPDDQPPTMLHFAELNEKAMSFAVLYDNFIVAFDDGTVALYDKAGQCLNSWARAYDPVPAPDGQGFAALNYESGERLSKLAILRLSGGSVVVSTGSSVIDHFYMGDTLIYAIGNENAPAGSPRVSVYRAEPNRQALPWFELYDGKLHALPDGRLLAVDYIQVGDNYLPATWQIFPPH